MFVSVTQSFAVQQKILIKSFPKGCHNYLFVQPMLIFGKKVNTGLIILRTIDLESNYLCLVMKDTFTHRLEYFRSVSDQVLIKNGAQCSIMRIGPVHMCCM